jgi:cellulose synthase/poly-beta-1,6-N-acetylglucosamine synthase-like glycosyltransferase
VAYLNPAFFFANSASALANRLMDALVDNTFTGVYRLQPFDWAIMVSYFGLLLVLSVYGMHRYSMIRGYWKYRGQMRDEAPGRFAELPRVTIQLPIYNEQYVVERLLEETVKMRYPRELLQIQVLDDSTDETHPFAQRLCAEYAEAGFPIQYIHRTNRHGFKAGAL